jgi:non-lysosomal glucosylceramidase
VQQITTGRRLALVTTALLSGALTLASCSSGGSSSSSTTASAASLASSSFAFPAAAVVRPLGEIPKGTCNPQGSQVCNGEAPGGGDIQKGGYPLSVPGLGVPVGGVGAGSFMVNQAGTFGPWDFGGSQDSTWEMRILPQAAFHFREQVGSSPATVKTLAT